MTQTCSICQLYKRQKELCDDKYLIYSITEAEDEIHRTLEACRKQLRIVIVGLQALTANDRSRMILRTKHSREGGQQPESEQRTSFDSESLELMMRSALQDLETGLVNYSRITSHGKEIKGTRELREEIQKALHDSSDCLSVDKKVEETCELRETNPLTFKAGIITHFIKNFIMIENDMFKLEELCEEKEVLDELPYVEEQIHRDMDSATKGLIKTVERLSAIKEDQGKAQVSRTEAAISDREALR